MPRVYRENCTPSSTAAIGIEDRQIHKDDWMLLGRIYVMANDTSDAHLDLADADLTELYWQCHLIKKKLQNRWRSYDEQLF